MGGRKEEHVTFPLKSLDVIIGWMLACGMVSAGLDQTTAYLRNSTKSKLKKSISFNKSRDILGRPQRAPCDRKVCCLFSRGKWDQLILAIKERKPRLTFAN